MAEKKSHSRALLLVLGIVAVVSVLLWVGRGQGPGLVWLKQKVAQVSAVQLQQKSVVAIAPLQVEQKVESLPAIMPPVKDEVTSLNDMGVDLVLKKQYWPGIFLFKQAMELDPSRIEPVMNMAVILDEIGLSLPAARYLAMAEAMDPDYSLLPINRQQRQDRVQSVSPEQPAELLHDQKH